MATEGAITPTDTQSPQAVQTSRPLSRRKKRRLVLGLVVVATVLIIIFWGWSSTGGSYLKVGDLRAHEAQYLNKTVEVQGRVAGWSGDGLDFSLVDSQNASKNIDVSMQGALPEGFENGKDVVVKGTLVDSPALVILGTGITVGCASKY